MNLKLILLTALALVLAACAGTDPRTGASNDSIVSVAYGTVRQVEQVELDPNYGKGALIGGGLGAIAGSGKSSGTQAGIAVAGALVGALVAKETAGTANRYTVALVSGNTVAVVTEQSGIGPGDCVSVEQGKHANLRRVSPVMCSTPPSHPAYEEMNSVVEVESTECHVAKEKMMAASTEQEADVAYRKMKAFCHQ
jgi:hypothetical protein